MSEFNTNYQTNYITFNKYLSKVFGRVALGLFITAVVSFLFSVFFVDFLYLVGNAYMFFVIALAVAEIVVVIIFSKNLLTMSESKCKTLFVVYSVLTGLSLTGLLIIYTYTSVFSAFLITSVMFACMAIIGNNTSIDLSKISGLIVPALITLIIATLLNVFLFKSTTFEWALQFIGIILFLVIVAFDVQKLKNFYMAGLDNSTVFNNLILMGAFELYLDFINIFIRILRIFGRRRD